MKIYLATLEQRDTDNVVKTGIIENGFASYYYLRGGKHEDERLKFLKQYIRSIIVDSGAHTFFSERADEGLSVSVLRKETKTEETPDEYWEKYKRWLVKNYDYYDYYVELDIGEICGQDKVEKWREELKELDIFKKCITVVHPAVVPFEKYLEMLKTTESKFIALEGDRSNRPRLPYNKYIKEAYPKVKIHGFALTKDNIYSKYPFYSLDSSSWKTGAVYGSGKVKVKTGLKIITFKKREDVFSVEDKLISNALSDNKKEARMARYILSAKAYQETANEITRLWAKRGIIWEK